MTGKKNSGATPALDSLMLLKREEWPARKGCKIYHNFRGKHDLE